jgi:hypothetical protein
MLSSTLGSPADSFTKSGCIPSKYPRLPSELPFCLPASNPSSNPTRIVRTTGEIDHAQNFSDRLESPAPGTVQPTLPPSQDVFLPNIFTCRPRLLCLPTPKPNTNPTRIVRTTGETDHAQNFSDRLESPAPGTVQPTLPPSQDVGNCNDRLCSCILDNLLQRPFDTAATFIFLSITPSIRSGDHAPHAAQRGSIPSPAPDLLPH